MRPYVSRIALSTLLLFATGCQPGERASAPAGSDTEAADEAADGTGESTGGEDPGAPDAPAEPDTAADEDAQVETPCDRSARVVRFEASDGVALEADLELFDGEGPAVVLLHMIPPANDRTSYPPRVRDALRATGVHVLNVDRRGAGGSAGEARDAYEGEGGRLDVEAAVHFLQDLPPSCGVDLTRLFLVGASNGTTSALDYAVAHDEALPDVTRMVWLSPGTYTETQHAIDDHLMQLASMRILLIHPESEDYAERFLDPQPAGWDILALEGGAHGTRNFDDGALEAQQLGAMVEFLTP